MPIYEYTCQNCQTNFEMIRPMKDADANLACIDCHSQNVIRRISLFNANSKGQRIAGGSSCSGCTAGSCSSCGAN